MAFDKKTWSNTRIDWAHHEIHDGCSYYCCVKGSLAAEEKINIAIKTPAEGGPELHLLYSANSGGLAVVTVHEGATVGTDGTEGTIRNNDRNSANTSLAKSVAASPTVGKYSYNSTITNGVLLCDEYIGVGNKTPGSIPTRNELILKCDTVYAIEIESLSATNPCSLMFSWYEHTPGGEG